MNIVKLNGHGLKQHWTRKLLPQPATERVQAIAAEVQAGTPLPPGYVVEKAGDDDRKYYLLVAGETRRLAHVQLAKDMEFAVISENDAIAVALGENTNRQAYKFKYQEAFIYCPLAMKVVEESNKRKGFAAGKPQDCGLLSEKGSRSLPKTLTDVAAMIGVSERLMTDAKATYDSLCEWDAANKPKRWGDEKESRTALDYWTDRIMDQEDSCTVGQARAGLAGSKAAEQGKTAPIPKQLELFCDGMKSVAKWGKSYVKLTADPQSEKVVNNQIKKTVAEWPTELRQKFAAEIRLIEREAKEQEDEK